MADTIEVRAPSQESEGTRSQVLRWLKAVGERVTENEPLLELETDKVTVEIAAPATGVLQEIFKHEQEEIAPSDLLARIQSASDATVPTGSAMQPPSIPEVRPQRVSDNHASPMSPAVRRLLAEHRLEPSQIQGTGRDGRITVDDILRHVADRNGSPPSSEANGAHPQEGPLGAGRKMPHSATRKRIATHMVQSLQTAPHVTSVFEADFSAVLAHRAAHKEEFERRGASLTLTAYVIAACVDAIRAVPEVNARWTEDALELFDQVNIGVGTAVETKGLIVPVVRHVENLDLFAIAQQLGRLVALAREDRLAPEDVRGGTFTISNHGVSGSLLATPIVINQPQVAILGVGKLEKRAVVVTDAAEERILVRPRCYITLTIDHRAMDGHQANRCLDVLVRRIESWPIA